MNQYTNLLAQRAELLSPEEEGYEEGLLETASLFRGFPEAFTDFLVNKGYTGDWNSIKDKVRFLKDQFRNAGFPAAAIPRNMEQWFDNGIRKVKRDSAFKICFAFGLNVDETNDFFRRVYLERSFDCHTAREAVYYFCIKNDLLYPEAREILTQIPEITENEKTEIPSAAESLYTSSITEYLDQIHTREELIEYITQNRDQFFYNNVKATEYIRMLWADITGKDGLAVCEGKLIEKELNPYHGAVRNSKEIAAEIKRAEERKLEDYVVTDEKSCSTWLVYAQILGLDQKTEKIYARHRSLSEVLKQNALLPLRASEEFPNRQNLEKILRGEHVREGGEAIRKLLIFLLFYSCWARKAKDSHTIFYRAKPEEREECLCSINNHLSGAGYPEMYAGNPYDWIFLWALNDEQPLSAFRAYIMEIFAVYSEKRRSEEH